MTDTYSALYAAATAGNPVAWGALADHCEESGWEWHALLFRCRLRCLGFRSPKDATVRADLCRWDLHVGGLPDGPKSILFAPFDVVRAGNVVGLPWPWMFFPEVSPTPGFSAWMRLTDQEGGRRASRPGSWWTHADPPDWLADAVRQMAAALLRSRALARPPVSLRTSYGAADNGRGPRGASPIQRSNAPAGWDHGGD